MGTICPLFRTGEEKAKGKKKGEEKAKGKKKVDKLMNNNVEIRM